MKQEGTIRHKLKQVIYRYLQDQIRQGLRQEPQNCKYNATLPSEVTGDEPVAVCLFGADNPQTWVPSICDANVDGGQRAAHCSVFCLRRSKEQIKESFKKELKSMSVADMAFNYPDITALRWVLDDSEDLPVETEEDKVPEPVTVTVPEQAAPPTPEQAEPPVLEATAPLDRGSESAKRKPWYKTLL